MTVKNKKTIIADEKYLKKRLLAAIGRVWMTWPPRAEAKRKALVPGKPGWWKCEECGQKREKIEIDHKEPVVSPSAGFSGWDVYIQRKFVQVSALRALCRDCHKTKSTEENLKRHIKAHKDLLKEIK